MSRIHPYVWGVFGAVVVIIAIIIGLGLYLNYLNHKSNTSNTPDDPDDLNQNIRMHGWRESASVNPWCVATQYRFRYINNAASSRYSTASEFVQSDEASKPMFMISMPPAGTDVAWQRRLRDDETWSDITLEFKDGLFIDTNNLCTIPYRPPTPVKPLGKIFRRHIKKNILRG